MLKILLSGACGRMGRQVSALAEEENAAIVAGVDVRTSLANQDVACQNELTVASLDTKAFGLTVTAVLGRTHTFFMSEQLNVNL